MAGETAYPTTDIAGFGGVGIQPASQTNRNAIIDTVSWIRPAASSPNGQMFPM
jgi:hypothetical protein